MSVSVGDIYCVFVEQLQKYTACQITSIPDATSGKSTDLISVVDLDWAGETLPDEAELRQMKPLYCDFYFWNNRIDHCYVEATIPKGYIRVGNLPPLVTEESKSYGSWNVGNSLYRQWMWQQIPADKREQFKQAAQDSSMVEIGTESMRRSTSAIYEQTMQNLADAWELAKLPCLTRLHTRHASASLIDYLSSNPFIIELNLEKPEGTTLDLSSSSLQKLHLNATGITSIKLNEKLSQLSLWGDISPALRIEAKDRGRWMTAIFIGSAPLDCGLDQLKAMQLQQVTDLDLLPIVHSYPALRELSLSGKPGNISNLGSIEQLSGLQLFSTQNIFGFSSEEFPARGKLPHLTSLWMDSLPADAAKTIKAMYKKEKANGLNLHITKPRKPEWLASNLDNPFRDWDGQEHITAASARKAAALYKKMLTEITGLEKQIDASWTTAQVNDTLIALATEYTETFNKMDRRTGFIETVEREEIFVVLDDLLQAAKQNLSAAGFEVDVHKLYTVFDETRDF